jgi:Domain of unknown function (DUF4395)
VTMRPYGQVIPGLTHQGEPVRAGVFNEIQVRVAAGLTLAVAAVAFAYANFAHVFGPIKLVTAFFFVDFSIRVTVGLGYSPTGMVARWMTHRQPPQWVSAKPKRFAWTLGVIMSASMTVITNLNIHGVLPRTICLTCLTLMWLEAVLGLCVGCEIYGLSARRGWMRRDTAIEICAGGVCDIGRDRRRGAGGDLGAPSLGPTALRGAFPGGTREHGVRSLHGGQREQHRPGDGPGPLHRLG